MRSVEHFHCAQQRQEIPDYIISLCTLSMTRVGERGEKGGERGTGWEKEWWERGVVVKKKVSEVK